MHTRSEQAAIILFQVHTGRDRDTVAACLVLQLRPDGRNEKKAVIRLPYPVTHISPEIRTKARRAAIALAGPVVAEEFLDFLDGLANPP
jgi:hypothetical protein